jgi:hypothetical protein
VRLGTWSYTILISRLNLALSKLEGDATRRTGKGEETHREREREGNGTWKGSGSESLTGTFPTPWPAPVLPNPPFSPRPPPPPLHYECPLAGSLVRRELLRACTSTGPCRKYPGTSCNWICSRLCAWGHPTHLPQSAAHTARPTITHQHPLPTTTFLPFSVLRLHNNGSSN